MKKHRIPWKRRWHKGSGFPYEIKQKRRLFRWHPLPDAFEHKLIIWLFLGITVFLSILSAVLPQKAFSPSENRYLAMRPQFTIKSLVSGQYGKEYEAYLSDQFPGRDVWIGGKVYGERFMGKKDVNGVYFGKDGYLLERFEEEDIEGELLHKNLKATASFTAKLGKILGENRVKIMLVPSSAQIMKNQLPFGAAPYDQKKVTEELLHYFSDQGVIKSEAEKILIPVEDALKPETDKSLYYRTDHHWTAKGAFTAYKAWALSAGLKPMGNNDFSVKTVSENFHGTIYSKINIPWEYDSIEIYDPIEKQEYRVSFDGEEQWEDTLYFYDALKGRDQYSVYLDGNHGLTKIENLSARKENNERKLLIIKDSFAHSFAPFAANHFDTVYMADLRYLNINLQEWSEENGITDVLVLYQIPGFAKEKTVSKLERY